MGGLTHALKRKGFKAFSFELFDPAGQKIDEHDLSRPEVVHGLIRLLEQRKLRYVHLGTPCSSSSALPVLSTGAARAPGHDPKEVEFVQRRG